MNEAKHWKRGGCTVQFREDGTLSIYQPDPALTLGRVLGEELTAFLAEGLGLPYPLGGTEVVEPALTETEREADRNALEATRQVTVPSGVLATSDGPVYEGVIESDEKPAPRRRGRPPRAKA